MMNKVEREIYLGMKKNNREEDGGKN